MGIGYVIEHYISYFHKWHEERTYKFYIADCMRLITENTAKAVQGNYVKARFAEIIEPAKEETRTANEIVNDLKTKLEKLNNE